MKILWSHESKFNLFGMTLEVTFIGQRFNIKYPQINR